MATICWWQTVTRTTADRRHRYKYTSHPSCKTRHLHVQITGRFLTSVHFYLKQVHAWKFFFYCWSEGIFRLFICKHKPSRNVYSLLWLLYFFCSDNNTVVHVNVSSNVHRFFNLTHLHYIICKNILSLFYNPFHFTLSTD